MRQEFRYFDHHLQAHMAYALRSTNPSITRQGFDPDKKYCRSTNYLLRCYGTRHEAISRFYLFLDIFFHYQYLIEFVESNLGGHVTGDGQEGAALCDLQLVSLPPQLISWRHPASAHAPS